MDILQVPLYVVALILSLLAAAKPHPSFQPLGLAFLAAALLVGVA